jgi:hypothetical protein
MLAAPHVVTLVAHFKLPPYVVLLALKANAVAITTNTPKTGSINFALFIIKVLFS